MCINNAGQNWPITSAGLFCLWLMKYSNDSFIMFTNFSFLLKQTATMLSSLSLKSDTARATVNKDENAELQLQCSTGTLTMTNQPNDWIRKRICLWQPCYRRFCRTELHSAKQANATQWLCHQCIFLSQSISTLRLPDTPLLAMPSPGLSSRIVPFDAQLHLSGTHNFRLSPPPTDDLQISDENFCV